MCTCAQVDGAHVQRFNGAKKQAEWMMNDVTASVC